ncbi:MAG: hypothetical protein RLY31_2597 [Bacteroidota bacterium]
MTLDRPVVMGILNCTPDSFYDGGRYGRLDDVLRKAEEYLTQGAEILDVGGMSSRPGAELVDEAEELRRVIPVVERICSLFPSAVCSVDTFRGRVAREATAAGAGMVNDISAGRMDPEMYAGLAEWGVPYVLMHMQGTPQTMQRQPVYEDVVQEVLDFLIAEVQSLRRMGVKDIVVDPGFGFGKTVGHNYTLLKHLGILQILEVPVLVGLSRKSMISKVLGISAKEAGNGSTALHMVALQQGARILRVHDVREAVETIRLWEALENA